jgi:hypothetical protein
MFPDGIRASRSPSPPPTVSNYSMPSSAPSSLPVPLRDLSIPSALASGCSRQDLEAGLAVQEAGPVFGATPSQRQQFIQQGYSSRMSGYSCAASREAFRYDSTAARSSVSRAPCLRPTNRHGGPVPSTRCPAVKVKVTGRYYGQKLIRRSFPVDGLTPEHASIARYLPLLGRGPHVIETRWSSVSLQVRQIR